MLLKIIFVIIIITVIFFVYISYKGNADIKNVQKYGGLKNKYSILIDSIMDRNAYYQLNEINANNVELLNTGMKFKLIEIDKKLQITWVWKSFTSGRTYNLLWKFKEDDDQGQMYKKINEDMSIQNYIDDGMTLQEARQAYIERNRI